MWQVDWLIYAHFFLAVAARSHMHGANVDGTFYGSLMEADWWKVGQDDLLRTRKVEQNVARAKNIILFIGDGMGPTTVTAARVYKEQVRGLSGDDTLLAWDHFPYTGFAKTYSVDYMVPDSAATATAFLSGVKTNSYVLGLKANVTLGDCPASHGNEVNSILEHSIDQGKWAGVVTTARVTHATPAAAYAHAASRKWESDADVPDEHRYICKDIASQFVDDVRNQQIRVMLGGGRQPFYPVRYVDPEGGFRARGNRLDGRYLTEEWVAQKVTSGVAADRVSYVMNLTDFNKVDPAKTDYLLGLFEPSHMQFELDREDPSIEKWGEPSLAQMTEKAIRILQRSEQGFFLLVEGGRIDHGHHGNWAAKALADTVAMSDALEKAREMTSSEDTLIVVSADHSHAFTINGYPPHGTNILGEVKLIEDPGTAAMALDEKPWMALGYHNGPGFLQHRVTLGSESSFISPRKNTSGETTIGSKTYQFDAGVPRATETHAGEDVAIYALGPWSHLFDGVHEQNFIAHAMMYAGCLGNGLTHCESQLSVSSSAHAIGNSFTPLMVSFLLLLVRTQ